jgi:hypothetical protein
MHALAAQIVLAPALSCQVDTCHIACLVANPAAAAAAAAAAAGFWGFMFAGCCHYWGMVWYFLPGEKLRVTYSASCYRVRYST